MDKKFTLARNLRKNSTDAENLIWNIVRNRRFYGLKFKRQYPIGKYIVDFVCIEKKLIIELDGGQHNIQDNINSDNERTLFLESSGYKVLRFWNNDIFNNLDSVLEKLHQIVIME